MDDPISQAHPAQRVPKEQPKDYPVRKLSGRMVWRMHRMGIC